MPNQFVERPNNIKFLNNTYYITGHTQQNSETNLLFLTLDTLGNVTNTIYHNNPPYVEAAGFSQSKLDTNMNGNFFIHYTKWSNSEYALRHERVELDTTGQIIFKKTLDTLDADLMSFRGSSHIAIDNINQVYYTFDNILPCDTCQPNQAKIVFCKFSQNNHQLLWMSHEEL